MPKRAWSWNDVGPSHKPKPKPKLEPKPSEDLELLRAEIIELRRAVLILANVLHNKLPEEPSMGPLWDMLRPQTRERAEAVIKRREQERSDNGS